MLKLFKFFRENKVYNMNVVDLTPASKRGDKQVEYLFEDTIVDYPTQKGVNKNALYLGHPDSVLLDSGKIIVAYPLGHGKGETVLKESTDGGKTWSDRKSGLPESFKYTIETPTIYKLDFKNGDQKLVMISARPNWGIRGTGNGFDATYSVSKDKNGKCDGNVWEEYENFFGSNAVRENYKEPRGKWESIVAMASLTKVKENGEFVDKWMGIFHLASPFRVFKTFLTFDDTGKMQWSYPEKLLPKAYEKKEKRLKFCEPEVVRSPNGSELAILFRANAKKSFSQVSFSSDEGQTWSAPQDLSRELTGERHKAEYDPTTGKLIVTFRSIDWYEGKEFLPKCWLSRGWLAWVGNYEDLHKGCDGKGDFVIKLSHTYLSNQTQNQTLAHADTGYAGLTIDNAGNVVTMSYGRFKPGTSDTFIISKRFKLSDVKQVL